MFIIIHIILFGALGAVVVSMGFGVSDTQTWTIFALTLAICANGAIAQAKKG